jgi:hypothetical protein
MRLGHQSERGARLLPLAAAVVKEGVQTRLGLHAPERQSGRLQASAPTAGQDSGDRDPAPPKSGPDPTRLGAPSLGEVALRGTVVQTKAGRVPETGHRRSVPDQHGLPATA